MTHVSNFSTSDLNVAQHFLTTASHRRSNFSSTNKQKKNCLKFLPKSSLLHVDHMTVSRFRDEGIFLEIVFSVITKIALSPISEGEFFYSLE